MNASEMKVHTDMILFKKKMGNKAKLCLNPDPN